MAHKKRGPFKGHCALCAIGRKWRRGKRTWDNTTNRFMGKTKRIDRHEIPKDQERDNG